MKSVNRYFRFGLASAVNDRRLISDSLILLICVTGAAFQPRSINASPVRSAMQGSSQTEIEKAISDLESPNPYKKEAARNHILALGNQAVEPIMSLLKRSLDEVADYRDKTTRAFKENPSRNSIIRITEPSWNIIDSCSYFLGLLKVNGAVPLFIRVIEMRTETITVTMGLRIAGNGTRTAEVIALESIGYAAEPSLLRELRTPRWALDSVDIGLPNDDPHTLYAKEHKVHEIRTQVLEVLAVIGNEGTMASLESLLDTQDFATAEDRFLLEHTIRRIRAKPFQIR